MSTEQEHSNQNMTGRGQNDRPRHWPTTPTHDRDNSDHPPGSFPRGDPEAYFIEADNLESGSFLQALVDSQPSWRRAALCRDEPLAIFFPGRGESSKPALTVCGPCKVRPECLAEAIAEELDFGVRGGMTARARVAARKAQATNDAERAA